jgi:hypothetical protein
MAELEASTRDPAPLRRDGVRRNTRGAIPEQGGLAALQRRANAGPGASASRRYQMLLGRAQMETVAQRVRNGHLSSGKVALEDRDRRIHLASADKADEHIREHPDTLRVNILARGGTLTDAVPDPESAWDLPNLVAAHAARVGQTEGDVCINCKSGKTRTPVVAIAYLILSGKSVEEAITTVAEAFKRDRPGVGIDYDQKLTGRRILDEKGTIDTSVTKGSLLDSIRKRFGGKSPKTVQEWKDMETLALRESTGKPKRMRTLWTRFERGKQDEDQRRQDRGRVGGVPAPSAEGRDALRRPKRKRSPEQGTEGAPPRKRRLTETEKLTRDFRDSPYWNAAPRRVLRVRRPAAPGKRG